MFIHPTPMRNEPENSTVENMSHLLPGTLKLTKHIPWKWMVGILVSSSDGLFSDAMLVSGSVTLFPGPGLTLPQQYKLPQHCPSHQWTKNLWKPMSIRIKRGYTKLNQVHHVNQVHLFKSLLLHAYIICCPTFPNRRFIFERWECSESECKLDAPLSLHIIYIHIQHIQ